MVNLFKALAIAVVPYCLLVLLLLLFQLSPIDAVKLALPIFSLVGPITAQLDKRSPRSAAPPLSLMQYSYSPLKTYTLAVIVGLALIALPQVLINPFLIYTSKDLAGNELNVLALVSIAVLPLMFICTYFVGRWVGIRCATNSYFIAGMACLTLKLLDSVAYAIARPLIVSPEHLGHTVEYAVGTIAGIATFGLIGLFGCFRGMKERTAVYLRFLLTTVSPQTRNSIIELVYEEASSVTTRRHK